ncbi:uncharacterized protein LOC113522233 [Galleria mellonella]|uniref:RNA-binding protein 48 n=1 Tax=Galleria mellonella TaxID=7137 RepID=A0ABM3M9M7_GALME|nr:uncharacterized protein LOC113522233 [Galleria mellonella]
MVSDLSLFHNGTNVLKKKTFHKHEKFFRNLRTFIIILFINTFIINKRNKNSNMSNECEKEQLLLHHVQQLLCTTRLPYRQGRKLTAVKVYTINNESNHLLIFGVPSLNLRQETKALFAKFGKLLQFNLTKHQSEQFTETYHARYEKIQSARVAKRMVDTKNFYGGSLHVCYAPEFEDINETRQKLSQRKRDVLFRSRNIHNDAIAEKDREELLNKNIENTNKEGEIEKNVNNSNKRLLNMGEVNTIYNENRVTKKKREIKEDAATENEFKPCYVNENKKVYSGNTKIGNKDRELSSNSSKKVNNDRISDNIEVVDCTSVDNEVVTNINESLNYKSFGNEVIKRVPEKTLNVIKFNITNKNT